MLYSLASWPLPYFWPQTTYMCRESKKWHLARTNLFQPRYMVEVLGWSGLRNIVVSTIIWVEDIVVSIHCSINGQNFKHFISSNSFYICETVSEEGNAMLQDDNAVFTKWNLLLNGRKNSLVNLNILSGNIVPRSQYYFFL